MEPSKANTVGIVKNSPSLCTTRKTLQFFRASSGLFFFPQNAKDNKPNHPLLLELPYLGIKPKTQSQQGKNDTLFKVRDPQWYLPTQPMHVYGIIPLPPPRRLQVSCGKQTWIGTTNSRLFMNFLLLNVGFVIQILLNSNI